MRRLYLQVYLTFVVSLLLVVLTVGAFWRFIAGVPTLDQTFEAVSTVLSQQVAPAEAPPEVQQRTVAQLAARFRTDLSLYGPSGERLAAAGEAMPSPSLGDHAGGLVWGTGGPAYAIRLPDGRWLVVRIAAQRGHAGLAMVTFLGTIALVVALCALPVVRQLTRRLERLRTGADSLGAGDLHARVKVEGRDEVAELAKSFNRAAARIEDLVDAHRMLLANASHELRTPLTRLCLNIELSEADELRRRDMKKDIGELETLVDEILLASRLDAIQHLDIRKPVELLALAAEECARYEACSLQGQSAMVCGDPTLLRRMIRNLLENAQRHGLPPIEVSLRIRDDSAQLDVSDHAPVIDVEQRERLFAPFQRIPGVSRSAGTGLGLALTRQIARRHFGEVVYAPTDGRNCFSVTLPILHAGLTATGKSYYGVSAP